VLKHRERDVVLELAHEVLDEFRAEIRSPTDPEVCKRLEAKCAQAGIACDSDRVARTLAVAFVGRLASPGNRNRRRRAK
jgi:hypothetical protein